MDLSETQGESQDPSKVDPKQKREPEKKKNYTEIVRNLGCLTVTLIEGGRVA